MSKLCVLEEKFLPITWKRTELPFQRSACIEQQEQLFEWKVGY